MNTAPTEIFYLATVDCGQFGHDVVRRDSREVLIQDLIDGQIEEPLRILEIEVGGMCIDVSGDIARAVADKAQNEPLPQPLINFIWDAASPALARELRAA
jgi:hypothetical protein